MVGTETCPLWQLMVEEILGGSSSKDFSPSIHNAIQFSCLACVAVMVATYVASEVTQNYSQVDKIWSIMPFVHSWILVCDVRTFLMAVLATIWGCRLTWNFHRRGGYHWPPWKGDEDYRWKYLQDGFLWDALQHPIVWKLFNLLFISIFQNFLLLSIVTPSVVAHLVAKKCNDVYDPSLNVPDICASMLYLILVVVETLADNQQYRFQEEKYRRQRAGEVLKDYKLGFNRSGFFAIVRKPNYACEQALWIVFYVFSLSCFKGRARSRNLVNWSALGWTLLVVLFQGSGYFTEKISLSKYPRYKEYMNDTPLYIPSPLYFWRSPSRSMKND
jgi:steroid 5-alpha reductase family enzyme